MKILQKVIITLMLFLATGSSLFAITKQEEQKLKTSIETLLKKDVSSLNLQEFSVWQAAVSGQIKALMRDRRPQAQIYEGMLAQKIQEYNLNKPKIAKLETTIDRLIKRSKELTEAKKELKKLNDKLATAQENITTYKEKIATLQNQVGDKNNKIGNAQLNLAKGENDANEIRLTLTIKIKELEEKIRLYEKAMSKSEFNSPESKELENKIKDLEKNIQQEKNALKEKLSLLEQQGKIIIKTVEINQKLKAELEEAKKEKITAIEENKKQKEQYDTEVANLGEQLKKAIAENKQKINELELKLKSEDESKQLSAQERKEVENQSAELNKLLKDQQNEFEAFKKEQLQKVTALEKELKTEKEDFARLNDGWKELSATFMRQREELNKLNNQKELKSKELEQSNANLKKALEQKNQDAISQAQKALAGKEQELLNLKGMLNSKEIEFNTLNNKLQLKDKELTESKNSYLASLSDLEQQVLTLKKYESNYNDLEQSIKSIKLDQQSALDSSKKELAALKSELEQATKNFEKEKVALAQENKDYLQLLEQQEEQLVRLEEKENESDTLISTLEGNIQKLKNLKTLNEQDKIDAQKEVVVLSKKLEDAENERADNEKLMDNASKTIDQLQNAHREKKEAYNSALQKITKQKEKMNQATINYEKQLEQVEKNNAVIVNNLKSELANNNSLSEQAIGSLKTAIQNLEGDNSAKDKEVKQLQEEIARLKKQREQDVQEIKESLKDLTNETAINLSKKTFEQLIDWAQEKKGLLDRLEDSDKGKLELMNKFNSLFAQTIEQKQDAVFKDIKPITFNAITFSSTGWKESFNTFNTYYGNLNKLTDNIFNALKINGNDQLASKIKQVISGKQKDLLTMQLTFINDALAYYYNSNLDMKAKDEWSVLVKGEKALSVNFEGLIEKLKSNELMLSPQLANQLENRNKLANNALSNLIAMISHMQTSLNNIDLVNLKHGLGDPELKNSPEINAFKTHLKNYTKFFNDHASLLDTLKNMNKNTEIYKQLKDTFQNNSATLLITKLQDLVNHLEKEF